MDISKGGKTSELAAETMDKIKEMVKKGNISKISVKKGDEAIVNIPVNVGVVGALVAPWGVIAAAIATVGFKCTVELTTTDGKVIDITRRAEEFAGDVKEKGSVVIDEVVEKSTGVYNSVKEAAQDKYYEFKAKKDAFAGDGYDDEDLEDGAEAATASGAEKACEEAADAAGVQE